jgi:hypothetical protein
LIDETFDDCAAPLDQVRQGELRQQIRAREVDPQSLLPALERLVE